LSIFRAKKGKEFVALNGSTILRNGLDFRFIDDSCIPGDTYKYKVKADDVTLFETDYITILSMTLTLFQNYPNPFNPGTSIKYYLPEQTDVDLRIYDASGRLIRILVSDKQAKGYHDALWDGKDHRGKSVSSGVYFYSLRAGKKKITKKMILLH